jgi:hypothetical protein
VASVVVVVVVGPLLSTLLTTTRKTMSMAHPKLWPWQKQRFLLLLRLLRLLYLWPWQCSCRHLVSHPPPLNKELALFVSSSSVMCVSVTCVMMMAMCVTGFGWSSWQKWKPTTMTTMTMTRRWV